MTVPERIDPGWAWDDGLSLVPFISQAVKAGDWLYISGQVALDPGGNVVGRGDMRAQSQRVFENIEAILQQAGGALDNLVRITAYLTDMSRYPEYNEVRTKFLGARPPASTTIQVSGLAFEGLLVEVDAVAHL